MRKVKIENIITERELQIILLDLEKRWKKASEIKDSRKKFREIMKIRNEAKELLDASKRVRRSANSKGNNNGLLNKITKTFSRWFLSMEKKYK